MTPFLLKEGSLFGITQESRINHLLNYALLMNPVSQNTAAQEEGGSIALRNQLRLHEDHIKVICRVRPTNNREIGFSLGQRKCVSVQDNKESIILHTKPDPKTFSFDYGRALPS